jgi:hypothetical protein
MWSNHGCLRKQPQSKRASEKWERPSSPPTRRCKFTTSAEKFMFTVFWDSQRVLLAHFSKRYENVNSASNCEILLKLQDAIPRNRPGHLARGVLLNHDIVKPQTARKNLRITGEQFLNIRLTALIWPLVTFNCLGR